MTDSVCRYSRFRDQVRRTCPPPRVIQTAVLNHQQVYLFRCHGPKLHILLNQKEFSHPRYQRLSNYLSSVVHDYPHHLFQTKHRSSKAKIDFDFNQTKIEVKKNHATRLANACENHEEKLIVCTMLDTGLRVSDSCTWWPIRPGVFTKNREGPNNWCVSKAVIFSSR